eukprot:1619109-Ditylum_brightwellii.AAC.1
MKGSAKVVVTGCMVNLYREEIMGRYPQIHAVLGSGAVEKILDALSTTDATNNTTQSSPGIKDVAANAKSYLENGDVPRAIVTPQHYAYIKIAEGCRKRCSFCVIPKIKGPLQSKPIQQVVKECKALLERDKMKELILIAQDLGDYGKDLTPAPPAAIDDTGDDDDDDDAN